MPRFRVFVLGLCCLTATLVVPFNASARNIDRFMTGSWYNPAQSGHGFSIEVAANGVVVVYWYTYHRDGTPTFILAVGQANGMTVTAAGHYNTGMRFGIFDPAERTQSPWGTITITFHDCNTATVEYNSTFEHGGEAFGSGSFPIQRLVNIDQLQCRDDERAGIYEGTVVSFADGSQFYAFALVAPDGRFAAFSAAELGLFGTLDAKDGSFTATGHAVSLDPNVPFSGALTAFGDLAPEYRLFAVYEITGGDNGISDMYATPALYRRPTSLGGLAGNYEVRNPVTGLGGDATISSGGSISGSDEIGCQYSGNVAIPNSLFNLFTITVVISSCPGFDGTYEGLGEQIDWYEFGDGQGLRLLLSNGSFGFLLLANK